MSNLNENKEKFYVNEFGEIIRNSENQHKIERITNGVIVDGELWESKDIENKNEKLKQLNSCVVERITFLEHLNKELYEINSKIRDLKNGKTFYDYNLRRDLTIEDFELDQNYALNSINDVNANISTYKKQINQAKADLERAYKDLERQAIQAKEDENKADDNKTEPAVKDLKIEPKNTQTKTAEDEEREKQGLEMDEFGVWVKKDIQKVVENSKKQEITRGM